jgi:hypothetical protein
MGFFQPTKSNQKKKVIRSILPQCGRCGRHTAVEMDKFGKQRQVCQSPKLSVSGEGQLKILIVREQPTQMNDATADWFASEGGKSLLGMALRNAGIDILEDCWVIRHDCSVQVERELGLWFLLNSMHGSGANGQGDQSSE